jgi:hypothetical protein
MTEKIMINVAIETPTEKVLLNSKQYRFIGIKPRMELRAMQLLGKFTSKSQLRLVY